MPIADALAGLFGGLTQGLGQVQKIRQQGFENQQDTVRTQLAQRQQQMLDDQRRREAVQAYKDSLSSGMPIGDDFNELAAGVPGAFAGLIKDPTTGQMIKAKSPQDALIEYQIQSVKAEADKRKSELAARQQIIDGQIATDDAGWWERNRLNFAAGGSFDLTSPDQDLKHSASAFAAQARANASMYAADQRQDPRQKSYAELRQMAAQIVNSKIRANPLSGYSLKPEQLEQMIESEIQALTAGGPMGSAPVGGSSALQGPAVGTKGMINGVPATWNGKAWVG